MKLVAILIVIVFIGVLAVQLSGLYDENRGLVKEVDSYRAEVNFLVAEGQSIRDDSEYFSDLENLEKELKARFDYKRPGETLIKIQ